MAPIAERFVRVRGQVDGFKGDVEKGIRSAGFARLGSDAGRQWSRAFAKSAQAQMRSMNLKVKVTPDLDKMRLPAQKPVKVPIVPDEDALKRTPRTRVPKVPVELDPLVGAFQAEVRKLTKDLAKQVSVKIPATPDSAGLRAELADLIRTVENQTRVKIPAGPDARKFETDLRALVAEVESQVKVHLSAEVDDAADAGRDAARAAEAAAPTVNLKADVDRGFLSGLTSTVSRIGAMLGPIISGITGAFSRIGSEAIAGVIKNISTAAANAGTAVTNLSTNLTNLIAAGAALTIAGFAGLATLPTTMLALSAASAVATSAVLALGGALASLPAIGVGLGAVVGTLGLGFSGLADHFKKTASGGGGAAKSMAAVKNATRAVAQAQRDLLKATKDIDKARASEIERIDDLGRALRGAYLDVDEAILSVTEAQTALNEAMRSGTVDDIRRAELALKRANLTLDEAKDRQGDLAEESKKASKDGVEGSDQVQAALERQRDATERLVAAQEALAEAQKSGGGGGGAAADLMKLAPAAAAVVAAIKRLKPAWEDLRLTVQERLFVGIDKEVEKVAKVWLPELKTSLSNYASTFNGLFKDLSFSVRKPEFVKNISSAMETVRANIDKVGRVIAGPLVDAFGTLAKAAKPFIDALGDKLAGALQNFADWVAEAEKSGKLGKFFEDAAEALRDLWDIGGTVVTIMGQLFAIFTGSDTNANNQSVLDKVKEKLQEVSDWLKDPENQEKVKEFIDGVFQLAIVIKDIIGWIADTGIPTVQGWIDTVQGWVDKVEEWGDTIERWKERLWGAVTSVSTAFGLMSGSADKNTSSSKGILGSLPGYIRDLGGRISGAASGMWDGIRNSFRSTLNWIIDKWNNLSFTVPAISFPAWLGGGTFGGNVVGTRDVARLAKGGLVKATPGGRMVNVAEGGQDEIVSPKPALIDAMVEALRAVFGDGAGLAGAGGGTIVIPVYIGTEKVDELVVGAVQRNPDKVSKAARLGDRRRNNVS